MTNNALIIQGGMGIAISGWPLAKAVSLQGQLGVVSGTGIDSVFVRKLQNGDPQGHLRRAMEFFPNQDIVKKVYDKYFRPTPNPGKSFLNLPLPTQKLHPLHEAVIVLANFVEVFLAKEGHAGKIGLNLLEKLQMTTLPGLYGAMLAGVDYVIMGAGIPREIPGSLDKLSEHKDAELNLDVAGKTSEDHFTTLFSPKNILQKTDTPLKRPQFLAIISSNVLATTLKKKANGKVDGFIVEKPSAGGHNAPPRGPLKLSEKDEPIYGEKDEVNIEALKKLDIPFWMAGGYGSAEGLKKALEIGAQGVQVGTLFALCNESGFDETLKKSILNNIWSGDLNIKTDHRASPTGFPFKVAQMESTYSEKDLFESRKRVCNIGYLRKVYKKEDGTLGYRCAAEPEKNYLKKGGEMESTVGRKCLCNALMANIGLGQVRSDASVELPIITLGDDIFGAKEFLSEDDKTYSAKDVIQRLLPS